MIRDRIGVPVCADFVPPVVILPPLIAPTRQQRASITSLLPTTPLRSTGGLVNQSRDESLSIVNGSLDLTNLEQLAQREKLLKDSTMEPAVPSWLNEYAPVKSEAGHSKHARSYTQGDIFLFTDRAQDIERSTYSSTSVAREPSPNQNALLNNGLLKAAKKKRKQSGGRKRGSPNFPAVSETNELELLLKKIGGLSWFPSKRGGKDNDSSSVMAKDTEGLVAASATVEAKGLVAASSATVEAKGLIAASATVEAKGLVAASATVDTEGLVAASATVEEVFSELSKLYLDL